MKVSNTFKILQVSPQDVGGGAERVALDLHNGYMRRNQDARLLVKFSRSNIPGVCEMDPFLKASRWERLEAIFARQLASRKHFRGRDTLRVILADLAMPKRWIDRLHGFDDFNYPGTGLLWQNNRWKADVIQLHNLHGNYFDLRALPALSEAGPVVWTLHDTWALTGHCGYFIDCQRWKQRCGDCPDLKRAPAVRRDQTHQNWLQKRDIYARSRLHIVSPSHWLMSQVEDSILRPVTKNVIPNGVDLKIFRPGDRMAARKMLGLPENEFICLFVAISGPQKNPYKDYQTTDTALEMLFQIPLPRPIKFVCLGGGSRGSIAQKNSRAFVGRVNDPRRVALYYQAADVYLHAAHADNFPCTILEAQAVGLPVVTTAVGGILEQIVDEETGFLVPKNDSAAMAERIRELMEDSVLRKSMSIRAAERARRLFDLERQVDDYLMLYAGLLDDQITRQDKSTNEQP